MKRMSDFSIKILVIGDSSVGKTSLCNRYANESFSRCFKPTVGVEFYSKEYKDTKKDRNVLVNLWDIGGQDRYISMTHVYYKNADFCLIIFDLTNRQSFLSCEKWKKDLDKKYELKDGSKCPCLLIGNKCDLTNRCLQQAEIEEFCRKYDFFGYIECSVKRDMMATETLDYIAEQAIRSKEKLEMIQSYYVSNKIDLAKSKAKGKISECVSCFSWSSNNKCCI